MKPDRRKLIDDESGPKTLSELVYKRIREDIVYCRLEVGSKLRLDDLVERYGVGGGAIREALSRLTDSGLVTSRSQRGFFVTDVSIDGLLDFTKNRIWTEVVAVRSAISKKNVDWEAQVLAAHHRLGTVQPRWTDDDPEVLAEEWVEVHRNFHYTIVLGCDSPHMLRQWRSLQDILDLYGRRSATARTDRDLVGQHLAIMEAVVERRTKDAVHHLVSHILESTEIVLRNQLPDSYKATMDSAKREILVGLNLEDFG